MTTQAPNERASRGLLREIQELSDSGVNDNVQLASIENSNPSANPSANLCLNAYAVKCAIGASITSMLLGFNIGAMSDSAVYINKDKRMTERQVEVVAAILNAFSLLGSAMAGRTSDWIGRRNTIMLTGVFFFVGTLLMMGFPPTNALIMLGRAVTHVGVGFAPMIATVYIAEISPAFFRGHLTSFPEVSINFGILLGYIFNYATSKLHANLGRPIMLSLGAISPVLLIIGVCVMPESPRWLVMQGRLDDAKRILAKTFDSEVETTLRLNKIKEAVGIPVECNDDVVRVTWQSTGEGVWQDLLHPTPFVGHMLLCATVIHSFQQACGIDTIVLYSPRIFEKAGVTSSNIKLLLTIIVHITKAVPILIPTFYLDRVGRKRLMLRSILGMIFGLALLGMCLTFLDQSDTKPKLVVGVCIASLWFCVGFYSIGMGPITSVYSSEIFPLKLRAQGCAIGVSINRFLSLLMAIVFLPIYEAITLGGAAFLFMAIAILAYLFVNKVMPETQGWTLEEMWQIFGEFTLWRSPVREIEMPTNSEATARGADSDASS